MNKDSVNRCSWAYDKYPEMQLYHDTEWGVPVHQDTKLFEFLVLEGAQAGLSWLTILKRRQDYKIAFNDFDVRRVAKFGIHTIDGLLHSPNTNIVKNRSKIQSAITNARAFIKVQHEFGSFNDYIWGFVECGRTKHNFFKNCQQIPVRSVESDNLSKDLKAKGFSFVGSTICYAMMQAVGLVNDHITSCFRHKELLDIDNK